MSDQRQLDQRQLDQRQLDQRQLIDAESGAVLVVNLEVASSFWRRFKGLQLRKTMDVESGLLLVPCRSVHTMWMRFALDIAFINKKGEVLKVESNVKPWRTAIGPRGTYAIVETASGVLADAYVGLRVSIPDHDIFRG